MNWRIVKLACCVPRVKISHNHLVSKNCIRVRLDTAKNWKLKLKNTVTKYFLNVWIVSWDPFLMKKLLKSEICGSVCTDWLKIVWQVKLCGYCCPKTWRKKKKRTEKRKHKRKRRTQTHTKYWTNRCIRINLCQKNIKCLEYAVEKCSYNTFEFPNNYHLIQYIKAEAFNEVLPR